MILALLVLIKVAPYVGAWIETLTLPPMLNTPASRTLRGCVD